MLNGIKIQLQLTGNLGNGTISTLPIYLHLPYDFISYELVSTRSHYGFPNRDQET